MSRGDATEWRGHSWPEGGAREPGQFTRQRHAQACSAATPAARGSGGPACGTPTTLVMATIQASCKFSVTSFSGWGRRVSTALGGTAALFLFLAGGRWYGCSAWPSPLWSSTTREVWPHWRRIAGHWETAR